MSDYLADQALGDLWGNWPVWLMELGFDGRKARSIVGLVLRGCRNDATRANWVFRRVRDSKTVTGTNVVAYLLTEVENERV